MATTIAQAAQAFGLNLTQVKAAAKLPGNTSRDKELSAAELELVRQYLFSQATPTITVDVPPAQPAAPTPITVDVPPAQPAAPTPITVDVPPAQPAASTPITVDVPPAQPAAPTPITVDVPPAQPAAPASATSNGSATGSGAAQTGTAHGTDSGGSNSGTGLSPWLVGGLVAVGLFLLAFALVLRNQPATTGSRQTPVAEVSVDEAVKEVLRRELQAMGLSDTEIDVRIAQLQAQPAPGVPTQGADVAVQSGVSSDLQAVLAARWSNLEALDAVYRNQGHVAWAAAAGYEGQIAAVDARQPEEETSPEGRIFVSGLQVQAEDLVANYPACFTTDRVVVSTSETRMHKPDARNASTLYTNNAPYTGPATLWADCSNWGQLWPNGAPTIVNPTSGEVEELDGAQDTSTQAAGSTASGSTDSAASGSSNTCMSMADLAERGTINQVLEYPSGTLAGAQITFSQDWEAPAGWTVQRNGDNVSSVSAGDVASVWSPESCRPLSE